MRIGIDLACWANNRGYGRYTRNLLRALVEVEADTEHHYVGFADVATLHIGGFPDRLELVAVPVSVPPTQAAAHDGRRNPMDLWRMSRAVQRAGVDVVFFPSTYTYFPVLGRTRTVIAVHDAIAERLPRLIFPNRAGRLAWTMKTRLACWQARRVVTVSNAAAQAIQERLPVASDRVRVIHEAADPVFRPSDDDGSAHRRQAALRARFGISADARIVLYVGGFGPHKNVSGLIYSFSRLLRGADAALHLVLVGQTEGEVFHSEVGALREQVRREDLGRSVTFTGYVPDIELVDWYHAASCLVLPSFDEGFGLPVIEAMACGTPVIASRAGALPEVVGDGGGLLIDPEQPEELVQAMRELLLGDGTLAQTLRTAGLKRATELSWEHAAVALRAVFDEINPRRGSRPRAA